MKRTKTRLSLFAPSWWFPEALTNIQAHSSCFQWLFHTNVLSWLRLQILLQSLKRAASGLCVPDTSRYVAPVCSGWPWPTPPQGPRANLPSGQLQNNHTKASPPNHLHKWHTPGVTQGAAELQWSKSFSVDWGPAQLMLHHGQRSVITANSCSWSAWGANPFHWCANSNQGSTTRRECIQHT